MADHVMQRRRPSKEILSGESADVYFARAEEILEREGLDPLVTMEVFARQDAILCGIDEAKILLAHALDGADADEVKVEGLDDGDAIEPKEIVLRIRARYRQFGLYETAVLGLMSQSTGWATAARECVDVAAPQPVISFGARHVHPDVTDNLDYAAIVGGCVGASTPAGARLAGLRPTGTMPHSLVLIFGDTVKAAEAFDRDLGPEVPRIVLVDTFRDEAEEALRVAQALGDRLYGIRLDTPSERGRVTADLVHEVRARLDQAGYDKVKIIVSGGLDPDRIRYFKEQGAPVDSFAVGSYISGARPVDFTGDLKEIDGRPDRQARPHPGSDAQPALAAGRSRRLAGALGEPRVRTATIPPHPCPTTTARRQSERPRRPAGRGALLDALAERETAYGLLQRGTALLARRHHAQAAVVLERARRLEPGKGSIVEPLARAYYNGGRIPEAAEAFAQLIEIDPTAAYGHFGLGQSLKRLGRRDEARRHLRIAVAMAPGSKLYRSALDRLG